MASIQDLPSGFNVALSRHSHCDVVIVHLLVVRDAWVLPLIGIITVQSKEGAQPAVEGFLAGA